MKNRKISEIKNYQLVNGKLFLANVQREVFKEDKSILLNQFHFDVSSLMSIEDFLIIPISENLGNTFVFNTISNFGYKLKESWTFKKLISTVLDLQDLKSDFTSFHFRLYDLKKQEYIFEPELEFKSIDHLYSFQPNLFFSGNDNIIHSFHLPTETTLWQYSVADLGAEKVSKILGVFGQVVVVVCDYSKEIERPNGQKNTYPYEKIIGLNKDTGQLLYEVDGYELDGEYKLFGPSSCSLFVYNDGETILHALIGFYLTFDTQKGETKTLNIDVQAHDRGISAVKSASIDGDGIGFSAYDFKVGGFDSVVGVFNTKTLKIEEHYTYEEANKEGAFFGPGQPKIHGNKIYALDTKNTLHILEREEA